MRRSQGVGIVILALVGVSGCAGMPQRGGATQAGSPNQGAVASSRFSLRNWWSRWRKPEPAPVAVETAPVTDLRIETSSRAVPEREIWPDRSRSVLSRMLPSTMRPRSDGRGPVLGANAPKANLTAVEANQAIARMARPHTAPGDDYVLPVRMWGDPEQPHPTSQPPRPPAPFEDEPTPPSTLPAPIPLPGAFLERYSKHPDVALKGDSAASEDAGPPPTVDQATVPASAPALGEPDATLASTSQAPPPPPLRPSARPAQATPPPPPPSTTKPPAPALPTSEPKPADASSPEPAVPAQPTTVEPAHPEASNAAEPTAPAAPAQPVVEATTAEPPAPAAAPAGEAQPASPQAAHPAVAPAPQAMRAPTPIHVAALQPSGREAHRSWFLKWLRPSPHVHASGPAVYASPQSPAQLPPVLVPTSYRTVVSKPPVAPSGQFGASPTLKQSYVLPSPQGQPHAGHAKEPCFLVTRLHMRLEQLRRWKHEHICKNIQSFKEGLAGKHCCQSCGGAPVVAVPTAAARPSPQGRPATVAPQPQAAAQAAPRASVGLRVEPGHVAEGGKLVEIVAAQGLNEASKR